MSSSSHANVSSSLIHDAYNACFTDAKILVSAQNLALETHPGSLRPCLELVRRLRTWDNESKAGLPTPLEEAWTKF
jgi:hypothetical protein